MFLHSPDFLGGAAKNVGEIIKGTAIQVFSGRRGKSATISQK